MNPSKLKLAILILSITGLMGASTPNSNAGNYIESRHATAEALMFSDNPQNQITVSRLLNYGGGGHTVLNPLKTFLLVVAGLAAITWLFCLLDATFHPSRR